MSPFGDPESEMPDPDLREAMIRSLHETTRDPYETPVSGGASGSGVIAQHVPSPRQANTPKYTVCNRPPRIASATVAQPPAQLQTSQITPADVCLILEDRIKQQKRRVAELVEKVNSVDQEFTELNMNELNELKRSITDCQRRLEQARQGHQVEAIPRPPVHLTSNDPPTPDDTTPVGRRKSRSRPRSHVRGRSKADK